MKIKLFFLFVIFFVIFLLAGCGARQSTAETQDLIVFAASSLTDAFNELAETFEAQNPGVQIVLNFASSSQLAAQLSEGAAADIYASANPAQMQAVIDAGRIKASTDVPFVSNRLTVIVPADNPAGITALEDLTRPGIKLVLAVDGVPVREYTDEIVAAMTADFQAAFYSNLVSEEDNVRQVSAKIALGEADAGIVYTSDVTPDIADQVRQITIPDDQNVIATYPIAPITDASHPELAQKFIDFILSQEGQNILARWSFDPPTTN
ncbi:MAG: molybdate ABC transporter substrate-binding protein [Ardenticatenaceae bacterium]|nr:molybdate ABC transporter substrate-binding protein [Ardenticatenaceae bacterium]